MSWEISLVLSVLMICVTAASYAWMLAPRRIDDEVNSRLGTILVRVKVLEDNQLAIAKVAEDAKKLVSQQNLSSVFGTGASARRPG